MKYNATVSGHFKYFTMVEADCEEVANQTARKEACDNNNCDLEIVDVEIEAEQ